jgi:hypothetical protein
MSTVPVDMAMAVEDILGKAPNLRLIEDDAGGLCSLTAGNVEGLPDVPRGKNST